MGTCPNCGLWEGMHASGEYCRCNEDGWHNAQPIPQPEPDVPAEAHTAQCAAYQSRIAALEAQVKALTEERDKAIAYTFNADKHVELARTALHEMTEERDAQAEAVKSACRMAYRASYLGFDHAWGDSQISCIKNKIVRETMQDIARAAVEMGAEG